MGPMGPDMLLSSFNSMFIKAEDVLNLIKDKCNEASGFAGISNEAH